MMQLHFEQHNPIDLIPNPNNTRRHTRQQIRKLQRSIRNNGFASAIVTDEDRLIIAGHARCDAAIREGLDSVPVLRVTGLTDVQKRTLALADNRISEDATWDQTLLVREFKIILDLDTDFDLTEIGFDTPEIDLTFDADAASSEPDSKDDTVPKIDGQTVSVVGDGWVLGRHRLVCGNATQIAVFEQLMAGQKAQMCFSDPPYNTRIRGHVSGNGGVKHREFVQASGEMSDGAYATFLGTVFGHIAAYSDVGAIAFLCTDWRQLHVAIAAGNRAFFELKNLIVWAKTNAGMGTFYRSQHELILAFKATQGAHVNNFELGQHGRHRTNVWHYPGANSFGSSRDADLKMHPTVKPVAMVADAIKDCSHRGGIVLDPFAGSGTILIAAEKTGRRAFATELDPLYVDTATRRWQEHTGRNAIHEETGLTFDQLAEHRSADALAAGGPHTDEARL